jgi:hypothetical protein
MAKQILNTGTSNNDKSGDTLRAGGLKIKANFNEIYAALANDGSNISGGDLLKTGSYTDLRNLPDFHPISTSGSFNDLEDKPELSTFVAAPLTLAGIEGNTTGQIAADDNYVYVCTTDWVEADTYSPLTFVHEDNLVDYLLVAATSDVASTVVLKPGTIAPEVDFTITDGSVTRTITLVTEIGDGQGGVWYECTLDGEFTSVANTQYKIEFAPVAGDFAAHFTWNGAFQPLVDAHAQGTLAAKLFKSGDNTGRVITHAVRDSISNELTITYTGPQFTSFTGMSIVEDQPIIWKRIPLNVAADRLVNGDFEITINSNGGLTFPDGTTQTTAYTGEAGITKFVAVNNDGVISGSDDGITWNEYTSNLSNINRVAVGPNKIVYIADSSDGQGNDQSLWHADTYDTQPIEVTSLSTRGFLEVKYFKSISKFVAVGNDGDGNPSLYYSDDGIDWIGSSVDPTYLQTVVDYTGASFRDIAENELGFFVISGNKTLGGFFLSDITDTMNGDNHVDLSYLSDHPDEVVWANSFYFQGWHLFTDDDIATEAWCYNSESNPTVGTFQTDFITLDGIWENEIGIPGGSLKEFAVGDYAGMSVIMASTNDGQILYWPTIPAGPYVSIPKPYTATITDWTSSSTSAITTTGATGGLGEKFIVTGSTTDYNGTYYLGADGAVFTDNTLTTPFDTTSLDPFTGTATLSWSHGQYIDALHYNDGVFYAGNDNEEMFKSTNGGQVWTKVDQLGGGSGEGDGYLNDIDSYISSAGEITFSGVQIRGKATEGKTGLIKLVPNTNIDEHSFLDNGQFVQIYPTNLYDAPHIHIAAGVGAASEGDIFLGDDNKHVEVNHNGNVSIQSYNDNTEYTYNWSFNTDGSMEFPWIETNIHNGGNQFAQTLKFGNPNQQVIITGPTPEENQNAERIIIQGQRGLGSGEGGDVYLWAGDTDGTNGGDIKIYAGDADQNDSGYGGYVNIDGGRGFNSGGNVEITGGSSPGGNGGNVTIRSGNGSNDTTNGAVFIETTNNVWSFDRTGVLTLPVNGDIVNSNGTSVLGGGGASTGDFTFANADITVNDNASLTVTGNTVFTATISSNMGMAWSEDNSFLGTYTSGSIGYSDFGQFDGQKVIFFDNVMSTNLSTQLNAMAIGDTILVDDLSNPYTVTLTSVFSSSMGRFIASVTTPESNRTVTNQVVITRTVSDTNQFQFKGNGELVAPKVVVATALVIPSYTISECGFGHNTVAGTNGAIISVSDSDQDVSNPNMTAGYYPPNMLAYWVGNINQNPSPGQEAGAWVYLHQTSSNYHLVGN